MAKGVTCLACIAGGSRDYSYNLGLCGLMDLIWGLWRTKISPAYLQEMDIEDKKSAHNCIFMCLASIGRHILNFGMPWSSRCKYGGVQWRLVRKVDFLPERTNTSTPTMYCFFQLHQFHTHFCSKMDAIEHSGTLSKCNKNASIINVLNSKTKENI